MMISSIRVPDNVAVLAAKTGDNGNGWLPLWVHSLDVCCISERLMDEWLPYHTYAAMQKDISSENLKKTIMAIAMLHDVGKATALFQTRIASVLPALKEGICHTGLQLLTDDDAAQMQARKYSHAAAGETILLMARCPLTVAEIIGAHHGSPWQEGRELLPELISGRDWKDPRAIALWGSASQKGKWQETQSACVEWMMKTIDCTSFDSLPEIPQTTAVLLTGLVIMADWIASNQDYFPVLPLNQTVPNNLEERINRGWEAVHLPDRWKALKTDDLKALSRIQFGFEPNAVQMAMLETVRQSNQPGLIILEAPMGLGKTEAALLSADLLAEQEGAGGIFFGLPTQATANAIFDRVAQWGENQPETNRSSIRLAHGMADMNEKYQSLTAGSTAAEVEEDGDRDRLIVHEWFRGRKQALLADFVVGTVDQVLMSALRQKHLMLRHLGLCGKTVIIDECHAYDTYMNQYLEEALRWLGKYHTPVIMLSATLPAERRKSFIAAYLNRSPRRRKDTEEWMNSRAYPALTWTDGIQVGHQALPFHGTGHTVELIRLQHGNSVEDQAETVADCITEELMDGGCAAVILNTVQRAQTFAAVINKRMQDCKILLLHSRFVLPDRLRNEAELLKHMGKKSGSLERDKVIVIGTQVIEQSLDYDADVMITDLCPMDLLMQRIGRLHRHPVHEEIRPEKLKKPRCYILGTEGKTDKGSAAVYGEYLLMRTSALLPDTVHLPEDISTLVNDVYDENIQLSEVPDGYIQAKEKDQKKQDELKRGAQAFRIHHPDMEFCNLLTGSIPADDEHARAQVRAGDLTMEALLLIRTSEGELTVLPWLSTGERWNEEQSLSSEDCRKMLSQRISITAGLLNQLIKALGWETLQAELALPPKWEDNPWMKRMHALILDENLSTRIGDFIITYDQHSGLQWKKGDETS